ncbi:uncharacterized protein [Procambarus clarkii]|uniref:uncharacterized protein isoform X2 n=1 Tax=Procambarus clarkii TaxID=6728 RepID=UPI001E6770A8|nr:uncharacterized protein LOC123764266 isoform X2 [Procambarus clarkii]
MSSQGETYYFKVENVTIYDLFDWALERQDSGEIVVSRKMVNWENRVSRSPSRKATLRTGCLVKVNEQEVALFRLGDIVYAISEHCPHSGKCHHPKTRQDLSAMVYPVKVNPQNGEIAIGFNEFNPFYFKTPLA